MQTWWKRWAERLSSSAVPIDGDPGTWRKPSETPRKSSDPWRSASDAGKRPGRRIRPGRLEASAGSRRRLAGGGAIERSVWRDLQLPPPAA